MKTTVTNVTGLVAGSKDIDVYIGRDAAGWKDEGFGNPFLLGEPDTKERRAEVLAEYEQWFLKKVNSEPEFKAKVLALKGKTLGCWCHPKACHGDVIVAYLEWYDRQEKEQGPSIDETETDIIEKQDTDA